MNEPVVKWVPRALRVITAVWLILLTALVALDHALISRDLRADPIRTEEVEITRLGGKLAALEAALASLKNQPAAMSQATYLEEEQAQENRVSTLEQSLATLVPQTALLPIEQGVKRLQAEVWRLRHPPLPPKNSIPWTAARPIPASHAPGDTVPPFDVLGTELRGGEAFLAVAPFEARTIGQVRLLRPGEAEDGWTLTALNAHSALFEVEGHVHRVPLP